MNSNCAIIPGHAIGNIILNEYEAEMLTKLDTDYTKEERGETCYVYHIDFMMIWVCKSTRRVYQITVGNGFKGTLWNKIRIGSKLRDLKELGKVYCENEIIPVYMIEGIDGICFELEDDDSLDEDEEEDEKKLAWISVFSET